MAKYVLLEDEKWLYEKYVIQKKGTNEICKMVGAKSPNSIRQALVKFNIPLRTIGDGLRLLSKTDGLILNQSIIDGCLLGDASLRKWNKSSSQSYPFFQKRNKYYDHISFVAKSLFGEKWKERVQENNEKYDGKKYIVFSLRSLSNKDLQPYYERWYPEQNGFKKVIPNDIKITSELLLHWFLDDGNSYQRRRNSNTKQIIITFCSECFSKEDQKKIIDKIKDTFNLNCFLRKVEYGTGYQIYVSQLQSSLFYDIVGPCPIPSMDYKWK